MSKIVVRFSVMGCLLVLVQGCDRFIDIDDYGQYKVGQYSQPKGQAVQVLKKQQTIQQQQVPPTTRVATYFDLFLNYLSAEYKMQAEVFTKDGNLTDSQIFSSKSAVAMAKKDVPPNAPGYYGAAGKKLEIATEARKNLDAVRGSKEIVSKVPDKVAKLQVAYDCMLVDLRDNIMQKNSCTSNFYSLMATFQQMLVGGTNIRPMTPVLAQQNADVPQELLSKRESFTVYFDTDKDELGVASSFTINKVVEFAQRYKQYKINILGFADRVGPDNKNFSLSSRRAQNVKKVLMTQGLKPETMTIEYFGEEYNAINTRDGVDEPFNRRVIIEVLGTNK
jgi:outer membrane protein OmpA-like peptidoglycan-associated protein